MKNWNAAEIVELNINETAQNVFGTEYDNGYVGDGHIGLLHFENCDGSCGPNCPNKSSDEEFTS